MKCANEQCFWSYKKICGADSPQLDSCSPDMHGWVLRCLTYRPREKSLQQEMQDWSADPVGSDGLYEGQLKPPTDGGD